MSRAIGGGKAKASFHAMAGIVGTVAFVEFTSGFLQGFYAPMMTDIARNLQIHDAEVNWFESSQLMLAALALPVFSKLGDMFGYRRVLLWTIAITAIATAVLPSTSTFWSFLVAWTMQTLYAAWLPLNVAILWSRIRGARNAAALLAASTGVLVAFLQVGGILGALTGGVLIDRLPIETVLLVPAGLVGIAFIVAAVGVKENGRPPGGRLDLKGFLLLAVSLVALTGGFSLLRLYGLGSPIAWAVVVLGILLLAPFAKYEERVDDPLIDMNLLRRPGFAPLLLTAALLGVSALGAQTPMSTFLRTNPEQYGYGLGATGTTASLMIGLYLVSITCGALFYPRISVWARPVKVLMVGSLSIFLGYSILIPLHQTLWQVTVGMLIAGFGAGVLTAALPATVATEAPDNRTGMATGLTNLMKLIGGAIGSAVFGAVLIGDSPEVTATAAPLEGYMVVWALCGGSALVATVLLAVWPKRRGSRATTLTQEREQDLD